MPVDPVTGPGQPGKPQQSQPYPPSAPSINVFVDPPPSSFDLLPDRPDTAPILLGWGCEVAYWWDEGVGTSPLAGGPGQPSMAFWRIHQPVCYKTVTWVAQAIGGKPELPSPDTGSPNEVRVGKGIFPQTPQVNQDGLPVWTITGKYVYVCQKAPEDDDPLGTGRNPLSIVPSATNVLRVSDFLDMLGSVAVTGFSGNVITF